MRYWIETLGCPKNHVDSEKLAGWLAGPRATTPPTRRVGRARRRQHLRVHRGRARGVDRGRPRPGRRASPTRAPGRDRLHGRALRRRARRGPARGRPRRGLRPEPDRDAPRSRCGRGRAGLRPAEPAPPRSRRALGVRQGRRGLRPALRLLRDPDVPRRPALAQPADESSPRSRALAAGGVREVVLIAQDLASWGRDRRRAGRDEPVEALDDRAAQPLVDLVDALAAEVDRVRLLYLYPSGLTRRADRRDPRDAACPTSTSRSSTPRARCCARCAAGATPSGSSSASPRSARAEPTRDVPLVVHPRLPRRDRGRPVAPARVPRRGPARLGGLLHRSRPRTGTPAVAMDDQVDPRLALERLREVQRAPGRHHRAARATRSSARARRCSSTRPASRAPSTSAPRSTAWCAWTRRCAVGALAECVDRGELRDGPRGGAGVTTSAPTGETALLTPANMMTGVPPRSSRRSSST